MQCCDSGCATCTSHIGCGGCAQKSPWFERCDMTPHLRSPLGGSYYFRPYNYGQIYTQQDAVRLWGEDPKLPYANRMFESLYEDQRRELDPPPLLKEASHTDRKRKSRGLGTIVPTGLRAASEAGPVLSSSKSDK